MILCGRRTPGSVDASFVSKIIALSVPAFIPPLHIAVLYYFWSSYVHPVDRKQCQNSCWDTVFKGPYENGIGSYKHMYFNATDNFLKIWIMTVSCIIALYESARYLTSLAFHRRLRLSMFVLYASSVFSNYYSWWMYVNYWNDEFYSQWNHQMFFTITEVASTLVILNLADKDKEITTRKTYAIVGIALLHIMTGSYDQFIRNVIMGEGRRHQVVRDFGFMTTDVMNLVVPLYELVLHGKKVRLTDPETKTELCCSILFIVFAFVIYSLL